ncbi:LOW QUALITY PROTEIN: speedy protein C [Castor canadensis]|uniref:LOW QUALITY PROTEIN: speedy protein C n=1 Tax=Castor canadensis TaxID=51338 RepID=A0AC58KVE1_CASCN
MSDDQDSASVPVVITQVKLGDCSWQGGDNGLLHACQDQELQTFLHLLGEFTWERADCGPNVQTDVINGICPIQLGQREDSFFQSFLSKDPCFHSSDKYFLAAVLVYFQHICLPLGQYSSLFLALCVAGFLANDMKEDLEEPKCEILSWGLGEAWCSRVGRSLHQRDTLWAWMGFLAAMSHWCCEEAMAKELTHWAWTWEQCLHHGGVQRDFPQVSDPFSWGPSHSHPYCALCGLPQHHNHHPLPVSSTCPSLPKFPVSAQEPLGAGVVMEDFLIVLPSQMQLEPGATPSSVSWGQEPGVGLAARRQKWDGRDLSSLSLCHVLGSDLQRVKSYPSAN